MLEQISLENIRLEAVSIDVFSLALGAMLGLIIGALIGWLRGKELEKVIAGITAEKDSAARQLEDSQKALSEAETQIQFHREQGIKLTAEQAAFQDKIAQHQKDIKAMEDMMTTRFENLSNRIFEEKSEKFKTQSQESLNTLLTPLRERMMEFQKKVDESFGTQAKEQFALKEEIKNIVAVSQSMQMQTEDLTKALKGDVKTQGYWGEIMLEKILEASGLRKGEDYILQGEGLGLRHAETGGALKPDVVVNLPENKHVIIDSKVSLTHYERFSSEDEEDAKAIHLSQFIASTKAHITGLEKRRYQDTDQLGTPDFVLMFMPIEGAYMLALQKDPQLQDFAWNKKIVLVCPSTLFATLRTISSVWRLEKLNQNTQEIARQGGDLYDKVAGFVEDMQMIGKRIESTDAAYRSAMVKLSEGKGNILRRAENLKSLGAKTSKTLPAGLLDGMDDPSENEQKKIA